MWESGSFQVQVLIMWVLLVKPTSLPSQGWSQASRKDSWSLTPLSEGEKGCRISKGQAIKRKYGNQPINVEHKARSSFKNQRENSKMKYPRRQRSVSVRVGLGGGTAKKEKKNKDNIHQNQKTNQ